MKRLATGAKALWRDVLCFGSMIAFIIAAAVFLVLFVVAGMAFCFVVFFLVSADRLLARNGDHSIFSGFRESIRDFVAANKSNWIN